MLDIIQLVKPELIKKPWATGPEQSSAVIMDTALAKPVEGLPL